TRLYRRFRWGRLLEVFILDTRQYRSLNRETDGPGKSMLGAAQKRWLLDGVTSSTAVWKVVVTSVSLSIPTGKPDARDSWTGVELVEAAHLTVRLVDDGGAVMFTHVIAPD